METLITVVLAKDGDRLHLQYQNGDPTQPIAAITIEQLIQVLANMREKMAPPVRESDPQFGDRVDAKLDPRWVLQTEAFVGGAALHIRDPGLGWQAYALPLQSLRDLQSAATAILAQAETAHTSQPPQN